MKIKNGLYDPNNAHQTIAANIIHKAALEFDDNQVSREDGVIILNELSRMATEAAKAMELEIKKIKEND